MLFVSSAIRKENTGVTVPWLLDNIPATGALLRMEWMLHVMLSGISRGGGQAGAPRFPGTGLLSSSVLIHCTSLHPHVPLWGRADPREGHSLRSAAGDPRNEQSKSKSMPVLSFICLPLLCL